jgi:hypothetical protein
MWKNILALVAVALIAHCSYQQHQGKVALDAYQAREAQVRLYGSVCLPTSGPNGSSGWSYNLQLVINMGKGYIFDTQIDCERAYQTMFGKSPRRP